MRKIAANYIFPVSSLPIKNGILVLDEEDTIISVIDKEGKFKEEANLEFYSGVLIPGFVTNQSYASSGLSPDQFQLEELKNKLKINPDKTFEELLQTEILKKAKLFRCESKFGSFEAGKAPGVNLIYPFDFENMTLTNESRIKHLV